MPWHVRVLVALTLVGSLAVLVATAFVASWFISDGGGDAMIAGGGVLAALCWMGMPLLGWKLAGKGHGGLATAVMVMALFMDAVVVAVVGLVVDVL